MKTFKEGRDLLRIQGADGNWNYDPYMHGMYNGMELILAMIEERQPDFRNPPIKWKRESKFRRLLNKVLRIGKPVAERR